VTDTPNRRCRACGGYGPAAANFCHRCGRQYGEKVGRRELEIARSITGSRRGVAAIGTIFVGVLFTIGFAAHLGESAPPLFFALVTYACFAITGVVATAMLGTRNFSTTCPLHLSVRDLGPIAIATSISAAVSIGYVLALSALIGNAGPTDESFPLEFTTSVILAPIFEEWLCRGVMFAAASRFASRRQCIVLSAVLFAFLHGLEAGIASFPHRFVAGLAFGWLRQRTGSVAPSILAHAAHNAIAMTIDV
jgi:membrane protease YdiL (CAAX protease family)